MRPFKILLALLLLINFSGFSQGKKPIQKFKLPANAKTQDYEQGVVWVKLKEKHKSLFESSSSVTGKTLTKINMQSAQPLINPKSTRNSAARSGPRKANIDITRYYQIRFDSQLPIEDYINELYATDYFEVIEPAYTSKAMFTPNDPQKGSQYYLTLIKAFDAWDITQGDESMVIGMVDSGGDLDHPDLASQLFINTADPIDGIDNDSDGYIDNNKGWDFSGADTLLISQPDFLGDNNASITKGGNHSHGTWAAGCASAATDNGIGISGVGYKTKLLFTKHYADNQPTTSRTYSSNLYQGILYVATHGAKIINCSWGGSNASAVYQDIISYVTLDLGCLVIASSGNDGTTNPLYPAAYDYVLSVAGSDRNDKAANFTTYGKTVDITAPGVNTFTTGFDDQYDVESGTSFSAPIVSGAAALVWSAFPTYTPLQVGELLRVSADPIVYTNSDVKYKNKLGRGRLDIKNALTIESPSIRASRPLLVKDDGNPPDPGQTANLYFDFTNYLKSTSSGLEITISTTSSFLTITKNTIRPGIIPENTVVRNTLDPFVVTLKSTTPLNTPIEVLLTFKDGAYTDLQTISFVIPSYIDINENNITTTLSSNGRMGYEDTQNSTNGSGFVYNDENILYEMGLIMGTSSSDLFNSVRGINNLFDQDFTTSSKIIKTTPGTRSYSEVSGSFRNKPTAGSESLQVSYQSLVWKNAPYNNLIILEYKVKNTTANPLNGFYFGIFADWDISLNGGGDRAGWNDDVKLGYIYPAQASNLPQSGIQSLTGDAQYYAIDNDHEIEDNPLGIYDGYTDAEKFTSISSGLGKTDAGNVTSGNDVSHVVSSGPYDIGAGEEITIAFALHGASTYAELVNSAKYADSLYNFTLKADVPVVDTVEICFGETTTLAASGASTYNWYRNFTGGEPFYSGPSLTTSSLFSDTTFYVSNAANSYESVRTPASVIVKGNPEITASRGLTLCEGETITLQAKEADEYLWSTTETTQSIVVSTSGDYTVKVKDNTLSCESLSDAVSISFNPLPSAAFTPTGELLPDELITFTDESIDAVSWFWEFGDESTSTEQSPSHEYAEFGNYTVTLTVTSDNGCQDVVTHDVGLVTGTELSALNGLRVYPNPVNQDKLLIFVPDNFNNELEVSILNNQGQRVKRNSLTKSENIISVFDLSVGIYYVRVKSGEKSFTKKIMIQR